MSIVGFDNPWMTRTTTSPEIDMSETSTTLPAPSKKEILRILREEFPYLQEQYGITRLALYGSYIRMEPHPESDIDLMVEFSRPLGLRFVDLAYYLEDKLGLRVDLATFDAFRRTGRNPQRRAMIEWISKDMIDVRTSSG